MSVDFSTGTLSGIAPPPATPGDETWHFIDDLKRPMWANGHGWHPRPPQPGEADLRGGIRLVPGFPDPAGLLATAHDDLVDFCAAGAVAFGSGYQIETTYVATDSFESYRIEVDERVCRILAGDSEGIRRGIFQVEEMMRSAGGPFLMQGTTQYEPHIKSRISRCFFGPVKRPPRFRDELADDVDYYPDHYLNRLAHEGINGLWLTVTFHDLACTSMAPEQGADAARRLAKLRRTVLQCRRYGIGIYLFTIEPVALEPDSPMLARHPELRGPLHWNNRHAFCPWSEAAQTYLHEATYQIFSQVPHLAGMINISHGERPTNCQSGVSATSEEPSACPVCAAHAPWQNINATLTPMVAGMHTANPDAIFIAWFYMPSEKPPASWVYELPRKCPANITMQFNFESGVTKDDFGRGRRGADYWISTPGPSAGFERLARVAQLAGTSMSAKIQTGCSHEVATIPFVPAPTLLYRKFAAMRKLGVERSMLCWYFGNYPGVMNRAAGLLSFEPFPATEEEFLQRLLTPEWGHHAAAAIAAHKLFATAYSHYPLVTEFQYWGPMHDGVVWPLLLRPLDAPLAPTWQVAWHTPPYIGIPFPPAGDRIGEALGDEYTLAEALECCRKLSRIWQQGVALLRQLEAEADLLPERQADIAVARALGIQFCSGYNILYFYELRERMVAEKPERQLLLLDAIRQIVELEIANSSEMAELCALDSRLGFHSEAEGHKYFPAKLAWRIGLLRQLLAVELPALIAEIREGTDPFAAYSGRVPHGAVARSRFCDSRSLKSAIAAHSIEPNLACGALAWGLSHDHEAVYFHFSGAAATDRVQLTIEPRRLWRCHHYDFAADGNTAVEAVHECELESCETASGWQGWLRLPFVSLGLDASHLRPLRLNVCCRSGSGEEHAWITLHPWPGRLRLGNYNPTDLGWLIFEES